MVRIQTPRYFATAFTGGASSGPALRRSLHSQVSGIALRSAIGLAAVAGASLLASGSAWADCNVAGVVVQCTTTSTTDTGSGVNPPNDRHYTGPIATPISLSVLTGATVNGHGLAVTNTAAGGVTVVNDGAIVVDAGNTPTAGGTAALSLTTAGGPLIYTGAGSITNNGAGNAFDATQTGGVGSINLNITGSIFAATGEGVVVRDVATSTGVSVTTGDVTALTAGRDGIDVQTQSLTGDVTIVANGDIRAGNAGIVGAIFPAAGTGDINITANGAIDARFGIDAENFGTGSTTVTTVGPVTATTGNGIFALATGGVVTVNAGDVTATGNTAIVARQTSAAGAGAIDVTAGNVSGTTGIEATNQGTGATSITTNGTVTGTFAEGILTTGNGAVTVAVADTVTGATRGLSLIGGTGGAGDISVTGAGGFVGGTGDAVNILNNGAGTVTVDISGASSSAGGEGFVVRDTALGGDISVTTGDVTALAGGKDGIDVQTQSLTGNVTIVANGDIRAGNAGIVGAIFPAAGAGDITITANGLIDARFGVDAENYGTGSVTVTTVGPVTATSGKGIFAQTAGGAVTVNAGDVTSTGDAAIVAHQTSAAVAGAVDVTAGTVSGTTGIRANNNSTGGIRVTTTGTVTGTVAEGIQVTGNGAVTVAVADTVTGATRGLTLSGGAGGAGDIAVTGAGGFVGGSADAAYIQNLGSGTVTVDISGASSSAGGEGIIVRDTALGGGISVTTGDVTALTAGKDGIDVQTQTLTGDVTIVANGDIRAGNAGIVAAIFPGAGTGDIDVTANGAIDARFGIDAENFGTGSTTVTTVGPVNVTTGNGIFALATGGTVTVDAGDVTSTGNRAIVAQQTSAAGAGAVVVTAGNVSGTTGIFANNMGTGQTRITTTGTVAGTVDFGIQAQGGATAGDIVIDAMDVTGGGVGIATSNNGLGVTDITVRGLVQGGFNGVNAFSSGAQAVNIHNLGVIQNSSGQSSDRALNASGGVIEIMNVGSLIGTIALSGTSSQTQNSGSWNSIDGINFFLGVDDRLLNAGTGVIVGSGLAGVGETTVWAGLEAFSNGGLIQLQDGGTGDSIQTSANTQFLGGSVLSVDIGGLNSDLFFTTGTVNILPGSVLTVNMAQPVTLGHQYVVAQGDGGLIGQFDFADHFLTAFTGLRDGYTATTAYVEFAQLRALADAGRTPNQKAAATGADSLAPGNAVKAALLMLPDDGAAITAFDLLSGEIHPSARTAAIEDSRLPRHAVLNRLSDDQPGGAVWGQAYGGWGRSEGDFNAAKLERDSRGLIFGVDTRLGDTVTLGVAAGWTSTDLEIDRRASLGTVESVHGLAYLGADLGAWRLKAGAGYAGTSTETERTIIFPGFSAATTASYDGSVAQAFVEAGYRVPLSWGGHAEPFASVAMVRVKTDAFSETSGPAALSGEAVNEDVTLTNLGLRYETSRVGAFFLKGAAGWRHTTGDLDPVGRHAFAGGSTFTVLGAAQSEDAAFVNLEARWTLTPSVTFGLGYDGVLGEDSQDHAVTGGLKVVF